MDVTTENITKYSLGELFVPIKFKKISVSKDGDLTEDYFYVRGRKNPLHVIRQNLYKSHKTYYRIQSDSEIEEMSAEDVIKYLCLINEYKYQDGDIIDIIALQNKLKYFQRRRHLMIWHDGSTICNHSHVLFTCSEVYDKAIHLTDEEVLQIFGKKVDVQETIEQPQIYIFARCPGSTELTAYTST